MEKLIIYKVGIKENSAGLIPDVNMELLPYTSNNTVLYSKDHAIIFTQTENFDFIKNEIDKANLTIIQPDISQENLKLISDIDYSTFKTRADMSELGKGFACGC